MTDAQKKPIPKGLENNDAFREYRELSTEARNTLKVSGREVPDIARERALNERYDALKEVVDTQIVLITDQKRQLASLKTVAHTACHAIKDRVNGKIEADEALKRITEALLKGDGVEV